MSTPTPVPTDAETIENVSTIVQWVRASMPTFVSLWRSLRGLFSRGPAVMAVALAFSQLACSAATWGKVSIGIGVVAGIVRAIGPLGAHPTPTPLPDPTVTPTPTRTPVSAATETPTPAPTVTPGPIPTFPPVPTSTPVPADPFCLDPATVPTSYVPVFTGAPCNRARGFVPVHDPDTNTDGCVRDWRCKDGDNHGPAHQIGDSLATGGPNGVHRCDVGEGFGPPFICDRDRPGQEAYGRNIRDDGSIIHVGADDEFQDWRRAGICAPEICAPTPTPAPTSAVPTPTPVPGMDPWLPHPIVAFWKVGGLHQPIEQYRCTNPEDGPKFQNGNICIVGSTTFLAAPDDVGHSGPCDSDHEPYWSTFCHRRDWDHAAGPVVTVTGGAIFEGKDPDNGYNAIVHFEPGQVWTICMRPPSPYFTTDGLELQVDGKGETCTEHRYK